MYITSLTHISYSYIVVIDVTGVFLCKSCRQIDVTRQEMTGIEGVIEEGKNDDRESSCEAESS